MLKSDIYIMKEGSDKATEDAAKLLMQDPTIYAYDEIYDEMKKEKQSKIRKEPLKEQKVQALTYSERV